MLVLYIYLSCVYPWQVEIHISLLNCRQYGGGMQEAIAIFVFTVLIDIVRLARVKLSRRIV